MDDDTDMDVMANSTNTQQKPNMSAPNALARFRGTPDPGSPRAGVVAITVGTILLLTMFVLNQVVRLDPNRGKPPAGSTPATVTIAPGEQEPFAFASRILLKFVHGWNTTFGVRDPAANAAWMPQIDDAAVTPVEKFRAAIAAGHLIGAAAAEERLAGLGDLEKIGLQEDAALYRRVLAGKTLDSADRDVLIQRHGWFGRLALNFGKPATDPEVEDLLKNGLKIMMLGLVAFFGVGLAMLVGVGLFVLVVVMWAAGKLRWRFVPPSPGGSVFAETFPIFLCGFLLLSLGTTFLPSTIGVSGKLMMQWLLLPLIFWPLVRGTRWADFCERIGWTKGAGIVREIGSGVVAYLAGLPLMGIALFATLILVSVVYPMVTGHKVKPDDNPTAELVAKATGWQVIVFFLLATVWAPIVEEAVFRGSLHRHLRSRLPMIPAAVISSVFFGILHPLPAPLLLPVTTVGFNMALMREWRGSLIASMTAHALNNATILILLFTMMSLSAA